VIEASGFIKGGDFHEQLNVSSEEVDIQLATYLGRKV
jgi:hypothetical protein